MDLPKNPVTSPLDENPVLERLLGSTDSWPRYRRLLLTVPMLAATITVTFSFFPEGAFALAIGYLLALHRWVIEDGDRSRFADAWVCALITLPATVVIAWIAWNEPSTYPDFSTADRLWWPMAIVTLALALDRVRRPRTPTESIGASLAEAGRKRQRERRQSE